MEKLHFDVKGMSCGACSARVEKAVNSLDCIKKADVNLLAGTMQVETAENIEAKEAVPLIVSAVEKAGYQAEFQQKKKPAENAANAGKTAKGSAPIETDALLEAAEHLKFRFWFSLCFLVPLMYIAMHQMLPFPVPAAVRLLFDGHENALIFVLSQFMLVLPICYANRAYFSSGFKKLFHFQPNMDSLIAVGASAAAVYGVAVLFRLAYAMGHGNTALVHELMHTVYFESAGSILTLVTFGKWLEAKSKGKTRDAIKKLIKLAPKTALVEKNGAEVEVDVETLSVGDVVIVKPGTQIPVDGVIVSGDASIDESSLTGESVPVFKKVNDSVRAATLNVSGFLKIRSEAVGSDTAFSRIIALVEEAASSKAPVAKAADTVALYFVPAVMLIAAVTFVVWLSKGAAFQDALSCAISVLVISCPCALGLATPVAIMVGTTKGAENGILIKSGEDLQTLNKVDTIVLDKTGTVTEGRLSVSDVEVLAKDVFDENHLLNLASAIESLSEHPVAKAIVESVQKKAFFDKNAKYTCTDFVSVAGKGVKGVVNGVHYAAGNAGLFSSVPEAVLAKVNALASQGKTIVLIAEANAHNSPGGAVLAQKFLGLVACTDKIRETTKEAVAAFKNEKCSVIMLTGDNEKAAKYIASLAGIDNVISEVLPNEKEAEIRRLKEQGHKVAMIGDGINDAPALVRADSGIAIGAGTDVAIESAGIILVRNDLRDAVNALRLSKAVMRNIKQNLFWAFFYNTLGIPLAAGAFYGLLGIKLSPMIGSAAMGLSSVCVVSNALRLRFFKTKYKSGGNGMSKKIEIVIDGMMCSHCSGRVEQALNAVEGVSATVNLEKKTAYIEAADSVSEDVLKAAVTNAGYTVVSLK
ncbi:MAG: heavy metal translocating P-type ATPase [Spirochaetaceae bacterium]|nr:heavy metal translocating P-type ATPase [Spirochaetaceae bacterium]